MSSSRPNPDARNQTEAGALLQVRQLFTITFPKRSMAAGGGREVKLFSSNRISIRNALFVEDATNAFNLKTLAIRNPKAHVSYIIDDAAT